MDGGKFGVKALGFRRCDDCKGMGAFSTKVASTTARQPNYLMPEVMNERKKITDPNVTLMISIKLLFLQDHTAESTFDFVHLV